MDSREFGKLLAALRKQNLNEFGKTWNREELGKFIHISPHQLGRLERGTKKHLDTETLQLLADAFNLTTLERKELFFAAVGVSTDEIVNPDDSETRLALNKLLTTLKKIQMPAFLVDDYADIVASNMMTMNLYQASASYLEKSSDGYAAFNLLKFIYDETSGYKKAVGTAWEDMARRNINFFRRVSLRQRHKPYFKKILTELRRIEKFDVHWYEVIRGPTCIDTVYDIFKWNHPLHGPIHLVFTEATLPTLYGNLYLFTYSPMDINTAKAFLEIAREVGGQVFQYAPWPLKPLNEPEGQPVL